VAVVALALAQVGLVALVAVVLEPRLRALLELPIAVEVAAAAGLLLPITVVAPAS
jgi:hypothetical protein